MAAGAGRAEEATVLELLPSALARVELASRKQVLVHLAGAREKNFVRVRPGDRVLVELSGQDPARGRITRLLRKP